MDNLVVDGSLHPVLPSSNIQISAMNAREHLFSLYHRWREASEIEGHAIAGEQWDRADAAQKDQKKLQAEIIKATEAAQQEAIAAGARPEFETQRRCLVADLIGLKARNARVLAEKRDRAERRRVELAHNVKRLRKLMKPYRGNDGSARLISRE
jgi:hypothetical protein